MILKSIRLVLDKKNFCFLDALEKTAAFNLPDGIKYDPEFFYMKVRAVSAGEYYGPNKNADYFPEKELKENYKTFLNAHVFKNHENKDVANAIGDVISAEWDDKMKCVVLILRICRKIAPTIVRGFEKGFMTDVSMGCKIKVSICSYCGNHAKTRDQYCEHIKYMKHKIMPDGKRVYEINIKPNFHDISAVLNGAEKPAKVLDMIIDEKAASNNFASSFAKTASQELFMNVMASSDDFEKVAYDEDVDLDLNYESKSKLDKIAEIKKRIQGKIEEIASGEMLSKRMHAAESLRAIMNLFYNDYWDRNKCKEISYKIKEVAANRGIPLHLAFNQFLNVLDFAGIELTPHEFSDIYAELLGKKFPDIRNLMIKANNPLAVMKKIDVSIMGDEDPSLSPISFPSALLFSSFHPDRAEEMSVRPMLSKPVEDISYFDMMNFVKDFLAERSMHNKFVARRMSRTEEPGNNLGHFAPILSPKACLKLGIPHLNIIRKHSFPSAMYRLYQRNRVNNIINGEMEYGLSKFASYFDDTIDQELGGKLEKTSAISRKQSIIYGFPLVFGYSSLQKARINNDENVSGFNRFMADNPGTAYILQVMLAPKISSAAENAVSSLGKKILKKAEEETLDIFKDKEIENSLSARLTHNDINEIKKALIAKESGEDFQYDLIMKEASLTEQDVGAYLNACKDRIKGFLENSFYI